MPICLIHLLWFSHSVVSDSLWPHGLQHTRAFLSFTISQSLLQFMSIKSEMSSNHLMLCRSLLLLSPIIPSIRVFSSESALHIRWPKYWSFSFSISPSNEYSGLISFRIDWFDMGFHGSSAGKESACSSGDSGSIPGSGWSTGEGRGYPLQNSRAFLVAQLAKNPPAMRETWVQSLGWEDPLEKGSWRRRPTPVEYWRIPWTAQSMGSQRVSHNWATFTSYFVTDWYICTFKIYPTQDKSSRNVFSEISNPGLTDGSLVKNLPCNARDIGSILGSIGMVPHTKPQLSPCATTTEPMF